MPEHRRLRASRIEPHVEDVFGLGERLAAALSGICASGALKSLAGRMYHASVPSRAKISSVRFIEARSSVTLAQVSHLSAGIGTPHARWREMHQSGRVSRHVADAIARPRRKPLRAVDFRDHLFAQPVDGRC